MKCKLIEHKEISGDYATVYSIQLEGDKNDKLTEFISENFSQYPQEVKELIGRLKVIGKRTGAIEHFFKLNEGRLGDGVCALYDKKKSNLRLYCIRNGTQILIVGSGGFKPKNIRTHQEDTKLKTENEILRVISLSITKHLNTSIKFSNNGLYFTGNLEFDIED